MIVIKVEGGIRVLAAEVVGNSVGFELCIMNGPEIAESHYSLDACFTFLLQRF